MTVRKSLYLISALYVYIHQMVTLSLKIRILKYVFNTYKISGLTGSPSFCIRTNSLTFPVFRIFEQLSLLKICA